MCQFEQGRSQSLLAGTVFNRKSSQPHHLPHLMPKLKPTASPYWARDGGALEGGKKEPWVVHNAFPLVVGAVVGALGVFALGWAVAAMRGKASTEPSASDYVAMGQ